MNDAVIIKDLLVRCHIGISDPERMRVQPILINASLFSDPEIDYGSDNIEDCVDYGEMGRKVRSLAEATTRHTLEALAADIAHLCLTHPKVHRVRIKVEKRGLIKGIGSVGVQLERVRISR